MNTLATYIDNLQTKAIDKAASYLDLTGRTFKRKGRYLIVAEVNGAIQRYRLMVESADRPGHVTIVVDLPTRRGRNRHNAIVRMANLLNPEVSPYSAFIDDDGIAHTKTALSLSIVADDPRHLYRLVESAVEAADRFAILLNGPRGDC